MLTRDRPLEEADRRATTKVSRYPPRDIRMEGHHSNLPKEKVMVDGIKSAGDVDGHQNGSLGWFWFIKAYGDVCSNWKKSRSSAVYLPVAVLSGGTRKRLREVRKKETF
jgi:hypothetical protein